MIDPAHICSAFQRYAACCELTGDEGAWMKMVGMGSTEVGHILQHAQEINPHLFSHDNACIGMLFGFVLGMQVAELAAEPSITDSELNKLLAVGAPSPMPSQMDVYDCITEAERD